ncbi:hypothetical protein PGQ11_002833 [Apiospora arundinis]|uniref:Uncharacterized protein n=1 Tax=Apiospora arundinis TaxID=335852 RepID=A0ABR2J3B4_9PEZI
MASRWVGGSAGGQVSVLVGVDADAQLYRAQLLKVALLNQTWNNGLRKSSLSELVLLSKSFRKR